MPGLRHQLIHRSRDRDFLLRGALLIGAAGIALGFLGSQIGPANGRISGGNLSPEIIRILIGDPPGDGEELPIDVDPYLEDLKNTGGTELAKRALKFATESDPEVVRHYSTALYGDPAEYGEAVDAMRAAAAEDPPQRLANYFLADVLARRAKYLEAASFFRTEIVRYPDSFGAHEREVRCLMLGGDSKTLAARIDTDGYGERLDAGVMLDILVRLDRWWGVFDLLVRQKLRSLQPAWVAITVFAGLVWFGIIGLLGGLEQLPRRRWPLFLTAVALGVASTFVTLLALVYQEDVFGLKRNGELANDLIFCLSSVGLREELIKLLFFAPLLPVLLTRRSSMEALATAGCVGLGFALFENLSYAGAGTEGTLFARFITANFLHIAWTGMIGLALFHFVRWPKSRWEEFLATFVGVVFAHGFYDAFAGLVTQLAEPAGFLSIVILALTAYRYLDLAREMREGAIPALSPFGVFVIGGALIVAFSWIHACWYFPLTHVMNGVGAPVLQIATISFIFINRLRRE